jgi:hypothetical protein
MRIHTAKGRFNDYWMAVVYGNPTVYYGYGVTEEKAKESVMHQLLKETENDSTSDTKR